MARDVGHDQPLLGIMDISVERNAFGRQVDSFEEDLEIKGVAGGPFHGIFIRAPEIREVGSEVEVLCRLKDGRMVAARQNRFLVDLFSSRTHERRSRASVFSRYGGRSGRNLSAGKMQVHRVN